MKLPPGLQAVRLIRPACAPGPHGLPSGGPDDPLDTWEIEPDEKSCPPEAWSGEPLAYGKRLLSTRPERRLIVEFQRQQQENVEFMRHLALAQIFDTGTPHVDGRIIYRLPAEKLPEIFAEARVRTGGPTPSNDWWHFYETRPDKVSNLKRERVHVVGVTKSLEAKAIFAG